MKIKLLSVLILLAIININGMERPIEDRLSGVPELVKIIESPSEELIEAWKLATNKLLSLKHLAIRKIESDGISMKGRVPKELIEYKDKVNRLALLVQPLIEYQNCPEVEKKFFFTLINDWQSAKEKFPKLWEKYKGKSDRYAGRLEQQSIYNGILVRGIWKGNKYLTEFANLLGADI